MGIVPNALIQNVDSSVVVQKKMGNLNVELIVRGYLWGSMAAAYEKGDRTFCGLSVPNGLNRFQKFETPLFTPTTKDIAMKLYQRGSELMRKRGLILIDT